MSDRADPADLDAALLRGWPLPPGGDKFSRGTVLVIAGSAVTPGAALLAGEAALRMGAGRLQIMTAADVALAVAVAVPEAGVWSLPTDEAGTLRPSPTLASNVARADAVLLGPGICNGPGVVGLVDWVADNAADDATVVLDAAAIGAMSDAGNVEKLRGRLVLTPNDHELADASPDGDEPDAVAVARGHGAAITCFGTVTAADGRCWRVRGDQPGLGTSGSGDVLAGLVAGVAARGVTPEQAACWGTYAHTAAARALGEAGTPVGFLARELLHHIPHCLPSDAFAPR